MKQLAISLRPTSLDTFFGQQHLVGPGKPLRLAIEKKHIFSFILWGPPGVGKTTLARIYAASLGMEFFEVSAVSAGKEEIRKIVERPERSVIFVDEIHRFNKAQQDFLLPYVETGQLVLIGATTENPSFEIIGALLSRCQVFILYSLSESDLVQILGRANIALASDALNWLINYAQGDARQALSLLEHTASLYSEITLEALTETAQKKYLRFDKTGEEHYNTISAFIKSMRASNPDAALYYLARMVEAGEDPKFIARRLVIFASEDVGLADPHALPIAESVFRAVEIIGYPECAINLAHGTCYLARAPKSKASYLAYFAAVSDVKKLGNLPIPLEIRNPVTSLMKDIGYGKGYKPYTTECLLPEQLRGTKYLKNLPDSSS